jgi:hypothetical protein
MKYLIILLSLSLISFFFFLDEKEIKLIQEDHFSQIKIVCKDDWLLKTINILLDENIKSNKKNHIWKKRVAELPKNNSNNLYNYLIKVKDIGMYTINAGFYRNRYTDSTEFSLNFILLQYLSLNDCNKVNNYIEREQLEWNLDTIPFFDILVDYINISINTIGIKSKEGVETKVQWKIDGLIIEAKNFYDTKISLKLIPD